MGFGVGVPLCETKVNLKGVLLNGDIKAKLKAAQWFRDIDGGHNAHKVPMGSFEGHVRIVHRPLYTQLEDVSDELEFNHRYLVVKVNSVTPVVTPDQRSVSDVDTFVQVS